MLLGIGDKIFGRENKVQVKMKQDNDNLGKDDWEQNNCLLVITEFI